MGLFGAARIKQRATLGFRARIGMASGGARRVAPTRSTQIPTALTGLRTIQNRRPRNVDRAQRIGRRHREMVFAVRSRSRSPICVRVRTRGKRCDPSHGAQSRATIGALNSNSSPHSECTSTQQASSSGGEDESESEGPASGTISTRDPNYRVTFGISRGCFQWIPKGGHRW